MNKNIITPLAFMALSLVTAFAQGDAIVGTPTASDGDSNGVFQSPNTYEFTAQKKGETLYNFYGTSSVGGQWWVGDNSGTPWDQITPDTETASQPSFHMTEELCGGDEFFVGLGASDQINGYTSAFRMVDANTLLGSGVDIYFGLRDATQTSSPLVLNPNDYVRPAGNKGNDFAGLTYQDSSAPPVGVNNEPHLANFTDEFSWIHYETDAADDTIIFTVDMKGENQGLTEWVAYFVMPDDGRDCFTGTPYVDSPDSEPDAAGGLVFSWTVHATDGVGDPNPDYDPEVEVFFTPEPSSALMLLGGAGLMLLRRQRKVA
jgi:hypothetical protein